MKERKSKIICRYILTVILFTVLYLVLLFFFVSFILLSCDLMAILCYIWIPVSFLCVFGQGGLARCDSWGRTESDTTERLNWTELNRNLRFLYPLCLLGTTEIQIVISKVVWTLYPAHCIVREPPLVVVSGTRWVFHGRFQLGYGMGVVWRFFKKLHTSTCSKW